MLPHLLSLSPHPLHTRRHPILTRTFILTISNSSSNPRHSPSLRQPSPIQLSAILKHTSPRCSIHTLTLTAILILIPTLPTRKLSPTPTLTLTILLPIPTLTLTLILTPVPSRPISTAIAVSCFIPTPSRPSSLCSPLCLYLCPFTCPCTSTCKKTTSVPPLSLPYSRYSGSSLSAKRKQQQQRPQVISSW